MADGTSVDYSSLKFNEHVLVSLAAEVDSRIYVWNFSQGETYIRPISARDIVYATDENYTVPAWNWRTREVLDTYQLHEDLYLLWQPSANNFYFINHHKILELLDENVRNVISEWCDDNNVISYAWEFLLSRNAS